MRRFVNYTSARSATTEGLAEDAALARAFEAKPEAPEPEAPMAGSTLLTRMKSARAGPRTGCARQLADGESKVGQTAIPRRASAGTPDARGGGRKGRNVMDLMGRIWGMWVVRGIASILFGILTVVWPRASIAAIVLLFGIYALADGVVLLGFAFRAEGQRGAYVVRGLLSVAAGVVTFLYPGLTALSLYVLVGLWALVAGAAELAIAFAIRKDVANVGGLVLAGILSLACGVALLALPLAGVVALIGLIAAYAIVNGVVLITAGVRFHNLFGPMHAA